MDRRKILITGGAGYIGTELQKYLTADWFSYDVDICDFNQKLPLAEQLEAKHIEPYDGIVHLAALSGIIPCQKFPEQAKRRNLLTAANIFQEAARFKIPCIFTSSQAAKNPATSSYAMQKRTCELMAEQFNSKGAQITVFRMTNVYGGPEYIERKSTVIKQFVKAYEEGRPLQIDGNGLQQRDFLHVDDVCIYIERALNHFVDEPIDIGTGVGTSINDIASHFKGYPVEHVIESRTIGVESSIADPSRAIAEYGHKAVPKMGEYIAQQIYLIKGG
jgi:UDP-glucose 4-epimerase